jgi:hypothetical protein
MFLWKPVRTEDMLRFNIVKNRADNVPNVEVEFEFVSKKLGLVESGEVTIAEECDVV